MKNSIIRLQSIELNNFKNIEHGKIDFISYKKQVYYENKSEIIGIYGQNGSGKTSVINSLEILKKLISGKSLDLNMRDYIYQLSKTTELKFVFYIRNENNLKILVDYEVSIKKEINGGTSILKEKLMYKEINGKRKITILEINDDNEKVPILPKARYEELVKVKKENEIDIQVTKKLCKKENSSFIFNEETINMLNNKTNISYHNIMLVLQYYIKANLFIVNNRYSANINLNFMPISFRFEDKSNNIIKYGGININLTKETLVNLDGYKIVTKILEQMNLVLNKILPDFKIELLKLGYDYDKKGEKLIKVEMFSVKKEVKVPLRYESEGIKKIISILSTLISVFNNPSVCLAIDEIDSGIFEFLLGEILNILDKDGKGQLIFTSHNLRALEKISKDNIVISTTNSHNRFIRIKSVKATSNLRDIYLRGIDLGGLDEQVYDSTSAYEISHAFRKAGNIFEKE